MLVVIFEIGCKIKESWPNFEGSSKVLKLWAIDVVCVSQPACGARPSCDPTRRKIVLGVGTCDG